MFTWTGIPSVTRAGVEKMLLLLAGIKLFENDRIITIEHNSTQNVGIWSSSAWMGLCLRPSRGNRCVRDHGSFLQGRRAEPAGLFSQVWAQNTIIDNTCLRTTFHSGWVAAAPGERLLVSHASMKVMTSACKTWNQCQLDLNKNYLSSILLDLKWIMFQNQLQQQYQSTIQQYLLKRRKLQLHLQLQLQLKQQHLRQLKLHQEQQKHRQEEKH